MRCYEIGSLFHTFKYYSATVQDLVKFSLYFRNFSTDLAVSFLDRRKCIDPHYIKYVPSFEVIIQCLHVNTGAYEQIQVFSV